MPFYMEPPGLGTADWLCVCWRGVGPGGDVFSTRVTSERTRKPVDCVATRPSGHVVAQATTNTAQHGSARHRSTGPRAAGQPASPLMRRPGASLVVTTPSRAGGPEPTTSCPVDGCVPTRPREQESWIGRQPGGAGASPWPWIGQGIRTVGRLGYKLDGLASDGACQWPQGEVPFRAVGQLARHDPTDDTTFPAAAAQAGHAGHTLAIPVAGSAWVIHPGLLLLLGCISWPGRQVGRDSHPSLPLQSRSSACRTSEGLAAGLARLSLSLSLSLSPPLPFPWPAANMDVFRHPIASSPTPPPPCLSNPGRVACCPSRLPSDDVRRGSGPPDRRHRAIRTDARLRILDCQILDDSSIRDHLCSLTTWLYR